MEILEKQSKAIVLADGGANHFFKSNFKDSTKLKGIVGDLDSIEKEVEQYYKEKDVPVHRM